MPGGYPTNRLPAPYAAPLTTPPVTDEHVGPHTLTRHRPGALAAKPAGFAAHDNTRRPHHALQLRPPRPAPVPEPIHSRIRRRPVLGRLINEYESAA
jgi:hypothetical protein